MGYAALVAQKFVYL